MKSARVLLLLGLLLAVSFVPAGAQEEDVTDDEVNAVAKGLYCPVCENVPLDVCPTQACKQWRAIIREKLGEGWTTQQIETYFVDQYGDRVLASPPARGLNWLAYILPPAAFLGGLVIVARVWRDWRRPVDESTPEISPDDPYRQRLEQELNKRA